jgi:hypothetical protein
MSEDAPAAARAGERVLTRRCGHCGRLFEPTRPHQRHCRPSCRIAAWKARHAPPHVGVLLWRDGEERE